MRLRSPAAGLPPSGVRLADGRDVVVKVGPAPTVPLLEYESGMITAEAEYLRLVCGAAPVAKLLYHGIEPAVLDSEFVVAYDAAAGYAAHRRPWTRPRYDVTWARQWRGSTASPVKDSGTAVTGHTAQPGQTRSRR